MVTVSPSGTPTTRAVKVAPTSAGSDARRHAKRRCRERRRAGDRVGGDTVRAGCLGEGDQVTRRGRQRSGWSSLPGDGDEVVARKPVQPAEGDVQELDQQHPGDIEGPDGSEPVLQEMKLDEEPGRVLADVDGLGNGAIEREHAGDRLLTARLPRAAPVRIRLGG